MRLSDDPKKKSGLFVDDDKVTGNCIITGGCSIDCPEFVDNTKPDVPTYCPKCGVELFYRSWNEW